MQTAYTDDNRGIVYRVVYRLPDHRSVSSREIVLWQRVARFSHGRRGRTGGPRFRACAQLQEEAFHAFAAAPDPLALVRSVREDVS